MQWGLTGRLGRLLMYLRSGAQGEQRERSAVTRKELRRGELMDRAGRPALTREHKWGWRGL